MKYVTYYRMSTEDQTLEMQQQVVRDFAKAKNLIIEREFSDEAISGTKSDRAGFIALKSFLSAQGKGTVKLIIYHLDRISRDIAIWVPFRTIAIETSTIIISPISGEVDLSTNLGKFRADLDIVLAEFERNRIMERTQNGMIRLLKEGRWIFAVPAGYKREKGGVVKLKYPEATIVKEALEGYASGRFKSQVEVKRFLAKSGIKKARNTISHFLRNEFYTGFFEHPQLGIERTKGNFEPLISISTFAQILKRLNGKVGTTYQKKREDFPLQGIVRCECGRCFTPTWSKGRGGKYPYYRCQKKNCPNFGKHYGRDKVEESVKNYLAQLKPSKLVLDLYRINFEHVWDEMIQEVKASKEKRQSEIWRLDNEIKELAKTASKSKSDIARIRYENMIEIKEGDLALLRHTAFAEPNKEMTKIKSRTALNYILEKLQKLDEILENEAYETRRNLINLFFAEGLIYTPENKSPTASLSLFLELSGLFLTQKGSLEASIEQKSNQFNKIFEFLENVWRVLDLEHTLA